VGLHKIVREMYFIHCYYTGKEGTEKFLISLFRTTSTEHACSKSTFLFK
jgi:hypothetical protein